MKPVHGQHPLVYYVARSGLTQRTLAAALGIRQQSVYEWLLRARKDAAYHVPASRVRKLAALLHCRPAALRPDLWGPL